jgi:hypothetical protein
MSISNKVLGLSLMSLISASSFATQWIWEKPQRVDFGFGHEESLIAEHPAAGKVFLHVDVTKDNGAGVTTHHLQTPDQGLALNGYSTDHAVGLPLTRFINGEYEVKVTCKGADSSDFSGQATYYTQKINITKLTKTVIIKAQCPSKGTSLLSPEYVDVKITN